MTLINDIRFGFRMLAKNPWFTMIAVFTLALGIGVNSTVFTLVNGVLFKGLPFESAHEIMSITYSNPVTGRERGPMSYPDFLDYQKQTRTMKGLAAYTQLGFDISEPDRFAERVIGAEISWNLFSLLGQRPLLGRDFNAEDDRAGAEPVVMIGYGLWQTRYGGDPAVIGRTIKANLKHYTIVGIMPQDEKFPNGAGIWTPLGRTWAERKRDHRSLQIIGRLAPGVSLQQARAEFTLIAKGLMQTYPDTNKDADAGVMTFIERANGGEIRTVFLAAMGAVGFVLLIACANVANLMLSRSIARTKETSIRTALGASRWRVIRQLLVESVLLSMAGGVLGLGLSVIGVRIFDDAVSSTGKPYWIDFSIDYLVILYFAAISIATGIIFGLVPALQISSVNVNNNLKEGGRGSSGGVRARRTATALLVGEIGLTIVLLVGAGLMIRSFLGLYRMNVGVETAGVLTAFVPTPQAKYPEAADRIRFQEQVLERLSQLPGVDSLTVASSFPSGGAGGRSLKLQDRDLADANNKYPNVNSLTIAPGYFQALGVGMLHGREFTKTDGGPGSEAAVVNESFAAKYWAGQQALGKRIRLGDTDAAPWITVIGVAPNILQGDPDGNFVRPAVYVPYRQDPSNITVIARSRLPQDALTSTLRNELRNIDPDVPLFDIRTLDERLWLNSWPFRVFGALFSVFALIALLMSSVGIYGVTAYGVNQRTQEIGVRMALGASQHNVLWLVLKQTLVRIGLGLTIGLAGAFALSRVLSSLLFQVTPTDPVTFAAISVILSTVTLAASLIPAKRAMSMDPMDALRSDG